jgi:RHS repeat-associated protein
MAVTPIPHSPYPAQVDPSLLSPTRAASLAALNKEDNMDSGRCVEQAFDTGKSVLLKASKMVRELIRWLAPLSRARSYAVICLLLCLLGVALNVRADHAPINYFASTNYGQSPSTQRYPSAIAAIEAGWPWYVANLSCTRSGILPIFLGSVQMEHVVNYTDGDFWLPLSEHVRCSDGSILSEPGYNVDAATEQWSSCTSIPGDDTRYAGSPCPLPTGTDMQKSRGTSACACGDPIDVASGNVYETKTEYQGTGSFPLAFTWTYNSTGDSGSTSSADMVLGTNRTLNYLRTVRAYSMPGTTLVSAYITRPDGKTYIADYANGVWTLDADVDGALTSTQDSNGNFTGFTYLNEQGETEAYDASGNLLSITDRNGFTQTVVRNSSGQITSVQDALGRTLAFAYDSSGRIAQLTQPDGGEITFQYDSNNNLQTVTYPDGKSVQYNYGQTADTGGASLPNALTSVVDETGSVYSTTTYNSLGYGASNYLGTGVASYDIAYTTNQSNVNTGNVISAVITGPLGAQDTTTFQPSLGVNRATQVSQACSGCTTLQQTYTFGTNGRVATATDGLNNVTAFSYDGAGLLKQRIDAQGESAQRTTTFVWNDALRLPLSRTVANASNIIVSNTQWVYNSTGQTLARCDIDPTNSAASGYSCSATGTAPAGVRRSTYTYCTAVDTVQCPIVGLLLTATGPRTDHTQTTTYSYYMASSAVNCGTPGAACYQPGDLHTVTDALGHVTTIASYDGAGRITRLTDANGVNTDLTYTPRGWLASRTVGGATTSFTYMPYGAVQTVTDPDGVTTTYGYDTAHRLTTITDALGNYIQYTLDAAGDKTGENVYDSTGASHKQLTRTFNTLGQLTTVIDGLNNTVFNASASGNYDANGNLIQSSDGLGIQRQLGYDALNRLVQTLDNYNGTDTATQNTKTAYQYDSLDRLTQVTDPSSLNTIYSYDGLSDATGQVSPDTGTTSRTFDAAGNVLTSTDAKGITATNGYDALDRLISTSYPDSTQNVTYSYDDSNSTTNCSSSYSTGRLTRIIENSVTTIYCYDARGNVIQKQQVLNGTTDTTGYGITGAGRLSGIVYPSGTQVTYARDGDGRVQTVTVTPPSGSASTAVSNVTYQPFGPVSGYTLGNGQAIARAYDANYRLTDLTSPAFNLHVARDAMGDITAIGNAPGANPATETYGYDPLYRLTTVTEASGTVLESITYNQTGDRLSKTGTGLATGTYSYNPNTHQLISTGSAARSVDADGNTTAISEAGSSYGFGYSDRNRMAIAQLAGSTIANYTYNAMNERVEKVISSGAERYGYNEDSQILGEYGSTNRDYIWLDGIPVANVDTSGAASTIAYVTADQLGTPRTIADVNGNMEWQNAYQGNPWNEQAPASTGYVYNLGFPGQYFDAETGLTNNVSRDYDSSTGRYVESDPFGLRAGSSTYGYVGNNPFIAVDPYGLYCLPEWEIRAIAAAAAGAGAGAYYGKGAGAWGIAGGALAGALINGAMGAADGLTDTTQANGFATGMIGAMATAANKGELIAGLLGGGFGGAIANELVSEGYSRIYSNAAGGGVGAAAGAATYSWFARVPLSGVAANGVKGGVVGLAMSLGQSAVESALRAGNDCSCKKKQ